MPPGQQNSLRFFSKYFFSTFLWPHHSGQASNTRLNVRSKNWSQPGVPDLSRQTQNQWSLLYFGPNQRYSGPWMVGSLVYLVTKPISMTTILREVKKKHRDANRCDRTQECDDTTGATDFLCSHSQKTINKFCVFPNHVRNLGSKEMKSFAWPREPTT